MFITLYVHIVHCSLPLFSLFLSVVVAAAATVPENSAVNLNVYIRNFSEPSTSFCGANDIIETFGSKKFSPVEES